MEIWQIVAALGTGMFLYAAGVGTAVLVRDRRDRKAAEAKRWIAAQQPSAPRPNAIVASRTGEEHQRRARISSAHVSQIRRRWNKS